MGQRAGLARPGELCRRQRSVASSFTIAPVDAPGKIVYWAIPSGNSDGILRGIGEESVETVLTGPQVQPPASSTSLNDGCIGCHSATPDGLSVGFAFGPHNNNGNTYYDSIASIESGTLGTVPSYVTPAQLAAIRRRARPRSKVPASPTIGRSGRPRRPRPATARRTTGSRSHRPEAGGPNCTSRR